MNIIRVFLAVVAAMLMVRYLGAVPALCVSLAGLTTHFMAKWAKKEADTLREWNRRLDSVWVVDTHPESGEPPNVARVKAWVVADDDVFGKAKELRELLEQAQNPFYLGCNPDGAPLPAVFWIGVHEMPFQHGVYRTETWEEYEARIEAFVKDAIDTRHAAMRGDAGETKERMEKEGKVIAHEWDEGTYRAIRESEGTG